MRSIEYFSMSKPRRMLYSVGVGFKNFFLGIGNFFAKIPLKLWSFLKKIARPFIVMFDALFHGDWKTRLSFILFGFGHLTRNNILRGILYLAFQISFVLFIVFVGAPNLSKLGTLGRIGVVKVEDPFWGVEVPMIFDNSFEILLYSIFSCILILVACFVYYSSVAGAFKLQLDDACGKLGNEKEFLHKLVGKNYHVPLLTIPLLGIAIFTLIPILFMVLIAFTNYNSYHLTPQNLIDWVGMRNFVNIFGNNSSGSGVLFLKTFLEVLLWTLVWAFFSTFSNYFLGMIIAIVINTKGIKFKKVWRTILITTIAVPQFVSLLLINRMLQTDTGAVNAWLTSLNLITTNIKWLNQRYLTHAVIIIINTWIGVPYTMLICTGILMNIPTDLYESAKIDGASPTKMYMKITLPYMLFVTTPYLISQFVGNINNFNVIYLLSSGSPLYTFTDPNVPQQLSGLGQTDLLITWIYKICLTNAHRDYGTASVLSIMIFVIVAFFSLLAFTRSKSIKNEEDFQ